VETFVLSAPCAQNMLDMFQSEWASRFPPPFDLLKAGEIPLFQDGRIHWTIQELGGVSGLRILELGPLEGGHSYMLDRAGAASVQAIESNRRAFMKCLVAKEILGMNSVQFQLGDFFPFLNETEEQWDLCVASGVLYHMREPIELLMRIASHCERLFLWTHYYDSKTIETQPVFSRRFGPTAKKKVDGFSYTTHRHYYLEALELDGFCGGNAPFSEWIGKDAILGALRHFGFNNITVVDDTLNHPNGPAFSVLATK
jgi:hypothetical protein